MNKPNTTEEAVVELKHTIKTEIIDPIVLFCNKYISMRTKIILTIMATIFTFVLLVYSLYQLIN